MFNDCQEIERFLQEGIAGNTVLVVGDIMLDRYYFGEVKRISPEAPVPITRITQEQSTLGGAANVANNLALLGAKVMLAGIAGQDESRRQLEKLLLAAGINYQGIVDDKRPTTTKLRVLGGHQQMIRLDFEDNNPVAGKAQASLQEYIGTVIRSRQVQAVIISDYAKGVCSVPLCKYLVKECAKGEIPLIIDPKGMDWKKYSGATVVTPNLKELAEAAKTDARNDDKIIKTLADKIRKRFAIENLIVTRSEKGLSVISGEQAVHISTYAQEVFDVSGAGDTVIAVLGAALAAGVAMVDAAHLANLAAGIVVGKLGTYAVKRQELIDAFHDFCNDDTVKEETI